VVLFFVFGVGGVGGFWGGVCGGGWGVVCVVFFVGWGGVHDQRSVLDLKNHFPKEEAPLNKGAEQRLTFRKLMSVEMARSRKS